MCQNFFPLKKYAHWYIYSDITMNLGRGRKGLVEQSQNIPKIQKDKEKQGVQAFYFVSIFFQTRKLKKKTRNIISWNLCSGEFWGTCRISELSSFPIAFRTVGHLSVSVKYYGPIGCASDVSNSFVEDWMRSSVWKMVKSVRESVCLLSNLRVRNRTKYRPHSNKHFVSLRI